VVFISLLNENLWRRKELLADKPMRWRELKMALEFSEKEV